MAMLRCAAVQVRLFDVRGFCSSMSSMSNNSDPSAGPSSSSSAAPDAGASNEQKKKPRGGGKHVAHRAEIAMLPHPRVGIHL